MWPIATVGHLKPGWVDTGTIAARLARFFEELADSDPMFGHWIRVGTRRHYSVVPAAVTLPPDEIELRTWIDENPVFASREGRKKKSRLFAPGDNAGAEPALRRFLVEFRTGRVVVRSPDGNHNIFRCGLPIAVWRRRGPTGSQSTFAARTRDYGLDMGLRLGGCIAGPLSAGKRSNLQARTNQIRKRLDGVPCGQPCGPDRSAAGCRCR